MRIFLISICFLLGSCSGAPKGIVCVLGTDALFCTDGEAKPGTNPDFKIPYPIASTPFGTPPLNFIAIPPEYLQRLQAYAKEHCK